MICRALILAVFVSWTIPAFTAPCVATTPASTAEWLYRHDAELLPPKEVVKAALSKDLLGLLKKESECVKRTQEVCAIDANLWTNTQDGNVWGPVRFEESSRLPTSATVLMKYKFALYEDGRDAKAWITTVSLARSNSKACWTVDDIIGPEGRSLKAALRANE